MGTRGSRGCSRDVRPRPEAVVVTGIGLVTPLGCDRESSWRALRQGRSATRWLQEHEVVALGGHPSGSRRFAGAPACLAAAVDPDDSDPVVALALRAAEEALDDARIGRGVHSPERIGCVVGCSKGGLRSAARLVRARRSRRSFAAGDWAHLFPSAPAAAVAARFGLRGPCLCPVLACATGLASVQRGAELIRDGHCDLVLAGSADASLHAGVLGSFQRMGVLARGYDDPASACRPFDVRRNGFLVGEGVAILVLERAGEARARGAAPYAEWLAAGSACDVTGLTDLDERAEALAWLVGDVLRRAGLEPEDVDYVNLHGTATLLNDRCETRALRAALGPAADRVSGSSLKGAIGHLLGAAGSVETAVTLLAMRDGVVPPTVNLDSPDPACDLDCTPRTARPRRIVHALKLSLGFGGHLVAAALRAGGD